MVLLVSSDASDDMDDVMSSSCAHERGESDGTGDGDVSVAVDVSATSIQLDVDAEASDTIDSFNSVVAVSY